MQQLELACVRLRLRRERADAPNHLLFAARLEEVQRVQRLGGGNEETLPVGVLRWALRSLGRREFAGRVAGCDVQLVERDQYGLCEVERRMLGGRDVDEDLRSIERVGR